MDMWGEAAVKQPKKPGRKIGAVLIVAVLTIVLTAAVWLHPSSLIQMDDGRVFTCLMVDEGEAGIICSYEIATCDGAADVCGLLATDEDGTILAACEASAWEPEEGKMVCIWTADVPIDSLRPWACFGGRMLIGQPMDAQNPQSEMQPHTGGILVDQYVCPDGSVRIVLSTEISGLSKDMVYVGGFMLSPEGEFLDQAGTSVMIYGQSDTPLTTEVVLPAQAVGQVYQCAWFYYSMLGDLFLIGDVQYFAIEETAEPLPAFQSTVTPLPTAAPTPTIVPTSTPAPLSTDEPAVVSVLPRVPSAEQFCLYPADMRYYYQQLTENEQQLFTLLYDGIAAFEQEIDLSMGSFTKAELERVRDVLYYDCPELLQYASEESTSYSVNKLTDQLLSIRPVYYIADEAEFRLVYQAVLEAVKKIQQRSDFGSSTYDKELSIYRAIIENCYYDLAREHCAYADGVFLHGYAKCTGYAQAFSLACRYYGIPCTTIAGHTVKNGEIAPDGHMWNYVNIDGLWYLCDLTWDDADAEDEKKFPPVFFEILSFFNLDDAAVEMSRFVYDEQQQRWKLPSCTSTAHAFYRNSPLVDSLGDDWRSELGERLEQARRTNENTIALYFESRSAFNSMLASLEDYVKRWATEQRTGYRYSYCYKGSGQVLILYNLSFF